MSHDRGMMKWGAFATGELTEAQNTFEKKFFIEVFGFVSEFINNQVRIKSTDKIYLISIEQIINIS